MLDRIDRDLTSPGEHGNLASVQHLFEAALYIGKVSREVVAAHREALGSAATATFILGGQIAGERPDIILLYPEGNYIKASETLPFLQIGETKYGKFLLEVAAHEHVGIEAAAKIALSSMLSTARANISVGPPYDLGIYRNGSLVLEQRRIEADAPVPRQAAGGLGDAHAGRHRPAATDPRRLLRRLSHRATLARCASSCSEPAPWAASSEVVCSSSPTAMATTSRSSPAASTPRRCASGAW